MATIQNNPLPTEIRSLLDHVGRRIRLYVWVEGIAAVVAVLAAGFWLGLGLDWLFEPSRGWRVAMFAALALVVGYVLYRTILARAFVRLPDGSLALLVERRYAEFADSLATSVDLSQRPVAESGWSPEMLAETSQSAATRAAKVRAGALFNPRPLVRNVTGAALLLGAIGLFGVFARDAFGFYLERIQLSDAPWPRRARLDVVGFPAGPDGVRRIKVAEGRPLEILVRANNRLADPPPAQVELRYRQEDGSRGRADMRRIGEAVPGRDDYQEFAYAFKDVYAPFTFDVVGDDARVRDLRVEVVKNPEIVRMTLHCEYPAYMGRAPRDLPVSGVMSIPLGSTLSVAAETNKPLAEAKLLDPEAAEPTTIGLASQAVKAGFRHALGRLDRDRLLLFALTDADGIETREPYRLALTAIPDEAPEVDIALRGIGTAVTPQARIPAVGVVRDDYGLGRVWFSQRRSEADEPRKTDLSPAANGETELEIAQTLDLVPLGLKPGEKLILFVEAVDRCDLGQGPNLGQGRRFTLDIVTPEELRAQLERRELLLRRRFETIYNEMVQNREILSQIRFAAADAPADEEAQARRQLGISRVLQNIERSGHETLALADGFDDLRAEFQNNRIDTPELDERLKHGIADPLREIGGPLVGKLTGEARKLLELSADGSRGPAQLQVTSQKCDEVLVEMKEVLDRMLALESFNEVIDLLRGIIQDQDKLIDKTKTQRKEGLRELTE